MEYNKLDSGRAADLIEVFEKAIQRDGVTNVLGCLSDALLVIGTHQAVCKLYSEAWHEMRSRDSQNIIAHYLLGELLDKLEQPY